MDNDQIDTERLREKATELRKVGLDDSADMMEAAAERLDGAERTEAQLEAELARERDLARQRNHKAGRTARTDARRTHHDPSQPLAAGKHEEAVRRGWLALMRVTCALCHIDTGPSPTAGGVSSPALTFERWMKAMARDHSGVGLTDGYVQAVAARIEAKLDDQMLTVRSAAARMANRRAWLDGERDPKAWLQVFADAPDDEEEEEDDDGEQLDLGITGADLDNI